MVKYFYLGRWMFSAKTKLLIIVTITLLSTLFSMGTTYLVMTYVEASTVAIQAAVFQAT